jgi:hypothetical protein
MSFLFRTGDLDPARWFPAIFLAFLGGFGSIGAFRLQAQVLEALALYPSEGSSEDSTPGSHAEIRMAGIGMSPSNLGNRQNEFIQVLQSRN